MKTEKKILCLGLVSVFILIVSFSFAEEVFVSEIGIKYHKAACPFVQEKRDIKIMDKALALEEGYAPCRLCYKEDLPIKLSQINQLTEVKSKEEMNTTK